MKEIENHLIVNHISKYHYEISHYNRGKETVQIFYLEGNLSCQQMYKNFSKIYSPSITYNKFIHVFNNKFNLSLRKPHTDIFQICYDYVVKLKTNINNINIPEIKKKRNLNNT